MDLEKLKIANNLKNNYEAFEDLSTILNRDEPSLNAIKERIDKLDKKYLKEIFQAIDGVACRNSIRLKSEFEVL